MSRFPSAFDQLFLQYEADECWKRVADIYQKAKRLSKEENAIVEVLKDNGYKVATEHGTVVIHTFSIHFDDVITDRDPGDEHV